MVETISSSLSTHIGTSRVFAQMLVTQVCPCYNSHAVTTSTLTLLTSCVMAAGEDTAFAPLIPDLLHLLEGKGHFQVGPLTHAHPGHNHSIPYKAQLS